MDQTGQQTSHSQGCCGYSVTVDHAGQGCRVQVGHRWYQYRAVLALGADVKTVEGPTVTLESLGPDSGGPMPIWAVEGMMPQLPMHAGPHNALSAAGGHLVRSSHW